MRTSRALFLMSAFLLGACQNDAVSPMAEAEITKPVNDIISETDTSDVTFEDVLNEFRALNTRLENISFPLLSANTALCPVVTRDPGFTVHTVTDYPRRLRGVARVLLPVSDRLSIRTLRDGSSAQRAGVKAGDELVRLGSTYMPSGATSQRMYEAVSQKAFASSELTLTLRRDGTTQEVTVRPETICGYPVNVFFSQDINGHTDGHDVWITSELMRTVPQDVNLALIIAHEMAHAIAGHIDEAPSQALELAADRMALILMVRAGYDIEAAVRYWQQAVHPHPGLQNSSLTHPSLQARYDNFATTQSYIRAELAAGRQPTF